MKRGGRLRPQTTLLIFVVLLLSGCSQFSIYDQFRSISSPTSTVGLQISPSVIGLLVGGTEYFTASGGVSPYTFSVISGISGWTLDSSTGAYTAPSTPGTDTIQVTDSAGNIANAKVTVVGVEPLTISPTLVTLPSATAISYTFHASGGVPPYTYSLLSGSTGSINTSSGVYSVTSSTTTSSVAGVAVTDSLGITATTASNAITFAAASSGSVSVSPASATFTEGSNFEFVAAGGTPPYTAAVTPTPGGTPSINGQVVSLAAGVAGVGVSLKVSDSTSPTVLKANATINVSPAAPSNLVASVGSSETANLTWTNNSAGATGLNIERAAGNGAYSTIATFLTSTGPLPTSYQDTGLSAGSVYVYRVVAVYSASGTTLQSYSNYAVVTAQ